MTLPPHADVRDCRLYRFRVYHPDDMMLPPGQRRVVIGYIGETAREPLARLLEHVYDQPWADTIVGWDLDPRVFAGKAAVLEAERFAIEVEMPLYNYEHNLANPRRVEIWRAKEQREFRDAARPVAQAWVAPDVRGGSTRVQRRTAVPRKPRRSWSRGQKHALRWSVTWVVSTVAGWVWLVADHAGGWKQTGSCAALVSAALVGWLARWVWLGRPWNGRAWRRAARRRRKR
jgi:hypothetical protein